MIGKNNVNLIDDTYNANPESFRAAFKKIKSMSCKNKICVMGKMNELGDQSQYLEDQVIKDALDIFDQVIALNLDSNIKANNFKIVNSESIFKNLEMFINKDSVADSLADKIILTDDNPRFENPNQIVMHISEGIKDIKKVKIISDRTKAIKYGLKLLREDRKESVLLLAGKGHEFNQEIKRKTFHSNDYEIVRSLI